MSPMRRNKCYRYATYSPFAQSRGEARVPTVVVHADTTYAWSSDKYSAHHSADSIPPFGQRLCDQREYHSSTSLHT